MGLVERPTALDDIVDVDYDDDVECDVASAEMTDENSQVGVD